MNPLGGGSDGKARPLVQAPAGTFGTPQLAPIVRRSEGGDEGDGAGGGQGETVDGGSVEVERHIFEVEAAPQGETTFVDYRVLLKERGLEHLMPRRGPRYPHMSPAKKKKKRQGGGEESEEEEEEEGEGLEEEEAEDADAAAGAGQAGGAGGEAAMARKSLEERLATGFEPMSGLERFNSVIERIERIHRDASDSEQGSGSDDEDEEGSYYDTEDSWIDDEDLDAMYAGPRVEVDVPGVNLKENPFFIWAAGEPLPVREVTPPPAPAAAVSGGRKRRTAEDEEMEDEEMVVEDDQGEGAGADDSEGEAEVGEDEMKRREAGLPEVSSSSEDEDEGRGRRRGRGSSETYRRAGLRNPTEDNFDAALGRLEVEVGKTPPKWGAVDSRVAIQDTPALRTALAVVASLMHELGTGTMRRREMELLTEGFRGRLTSKTVGKHAKAVCLAGLEEAQQERLEEIKKLARRQVRRIERSGKVEELPPPPPPKKKAKKVKDKEGEDKEGEEEEEEEEGKEAEAAAAAGDAEEEAVTRYAFVWEGSGAEAVIKDMMGVHVEITELERLVRVAKGDKNVAARPHKQTLHPLVFWTEIADCWPAGWMDAARLKQHMVDKGAAQGRPTGAGGGGLSGAQAALAVARNLLAKPKQDDKPPSKQEEKVADDKPLDAQVLKRLDAALAGESRTAPTEAPVTQAAAASAAAASADPPAARGRGTGGLSRGGGAGRGRGRGRGRGGGGAPPASASASASASAAAPASAAAVPAAAPDPLAPKKYSYLKPLPKPPAALGRGYGGSSLLNKKGGFPKSVGFPSLAPRK